MKGKHEKRERLGRGEFQYPGGFNVNRIEPGLNQDGPTKERLHREALFLQAVFEVEPKALEMLESLAAELANDPVEGGLPAVPRPRLDEWCARFHLNAPWCKEFAQQQIQAFWLESQPGGRKYSDRELQKRAAAQELAGQPFQEYRLSIDFGSWPLTVTTRSEFCDSCRRAFEEKLEEFCDRLEGLALDNGMERTREKRELDHYLWLARYQVKGQTAVEIRTFTAGLDSITTDAITKAIRTLARELELPLRKDGAESN